MNATTVRRGDTGLGKTPAGGNAGSYAAHVRTVAAPPELPRNPLDCEFETLEAKVEAMSHEVQALVKGLESDEGWNNYLETMSKFHNYSLHNQLLIALQRPDATHVAGKTKWAELGRKVLPYKERGERRGIAIFRPKIGYFPKLDAQGNEVIGPDGNPVKERRPFGFTTATVYDITDTEGDELPVGHTLLDEEPPEGFEAELDAALTAHGAVIEFETLSGGRRGYTEPLGEGKYRVVISDALPAGHRAKTKAHELAHIVAGHLERGDEYHCGASGQRGSMEVEAESIAHVMLRLNGMDPSEQTGRYVAGWSKVQGDSEEVVKRSAVAVQTAVKTLIGERKWANVPDSGPQERKPYRRKTAPKRKAKS